MEAPVSQAGSRVNGGTFHQLPAPREALRTFQNGGCLVTLPLGWQRRRGTRRGWQSGPGTAASHRHSPGTQGRDSGSAHSGQEHGPQLPALRARVSRWQPAGLGTLCCPLIPGYYEHFWGMRPVPPTTVQCPKPAKAKCVGSSEQTSWAQCSTRPEAVGSLHVSRCERCALR